MVPAGEDGICSLALEQNVVALFCMLFTSLLYGRKTPLKIFTGTRGVALPLWYSAHRETSTSLAQYICLQRFIKHPRLGICSTFATMMSI